MNRKIGETFELFGYRLRVEESKKYVCKGCFFYEHNLNCDNKQILNVIGDCISDTYGLIFIEIEEGQ